MNIFAFPKLIATSLCGLSALALLAGCGAKKDQTPQVVLATDWYPQAEHGGFYHALVHGYYKEAGLNVVIEPGGPNASTSQKVILGRAQFGLVNSDDLLIARVRGLPIVAVGATMEHDPLAIVVHEESPVHGFADLSGQAVTVPAGSAWFRFVIKKFGLANVKEKPMTYSTATFLVDPTAIFQCFVTSEPFHIRQQGGKIRTYLVKDAGYDPYRVYFTSEQILREQPELVRAFVKASIRGWRDYLKDPELADQEIVRRNPQMTREWLAYSRQQLIDSQFVAGRPEKGEAIGKFLPERWKFQYETLRQLGVLDHDVDVTKAYTTDFYPKEEAVAP